MRRLRSCNSGVDVRCISNTRKCSLVRSSSSCSSLHSFIRRAPSRLCDDSSLPRALEEVFPLYITRLDFI